jgi:hypothetical protein
MEVRKNEGLGISVRERDLSHEYMDRMLIAQSPSFRALEVFFPLFL